MWILGVNIVLLVVIAVLGGTGVIAMAMVLVSINVLVGLIFLVRSWFSHPVDGRQLRHTAGTVGVSALLVLLVSVPFCTAYW